MVFALNKQTSLNKRTSLIVLGVILLLGIPALDAAAQGRVEVIVRFNGPPGQVRQAIESLGGEVKAEYTYLGSLLSEIDSNMLGAVKGASGVKSALPSMRPNSYGRSADVMWK